MCVFLYVTKWSSGLPKLKPKDSWGTMGTHTSSKTEIQFILDILLNTSSPPCSQGCLVLPPPHPQPLLCSSPVCTSGNFSSPDILRWYLILPSLWRSFSSDWLFTVPPLKIKSWSVSEIRSRKFSFVIPAMEHPPSTLTTSRELVIWTELFFFFFLIRKRGLVSEVLTCYAQIIPSLLNSERLRKDRLSSHFLLSLLILTLAISQSGAYTSISFRRGEGNSRGKARSIKMTF